MSLIDEIDSKSQHYNTFAVLPSLYRNFQERNVSQFPRIKCVWIWVPLRNPRI